ncbi:MAG: SxtJ family membrane protein [Rhodothermales bacterium]
MILKVLSEEIRNIDAGKKALRSFGLVVGGVFLGIAVVVFWRAEWTFVTSVKILGALGSVLVVFGLVAPTLLRPVYRVWMAIAVILGFIMTRVLLTLVFFLVVTPIGLLMRAFGRDPLNRKLDKNVSSYWIPKKYLDRSPKRLEKYY